MTEEMRSETATAEESATSQAIAMFQDTLGEFLATASVNRVYGEPILRDDTAIIPAAEVLTGLAYGVGAGSGPSGEGEAMGGGVGGGGGGRTLARPVAMIIASPAGVTVEPVVDVSKIAIAAITAAGFMLAMILRLMSPKKALQELKGQ